MLNKIGFDELGGLAHLRLQPDAIVIALARGERQFRRDAESEIGGVGGDRTERFPLLHVPDERLAQVTVLPFQQSNARHMVCAFHQK
jgi:hypothetical protein